ncbi:MAG: pyrophosphatase [Rikenellaceae bacterium]|jgi:NTP pyrophosphatase (non-canonical NTP hydrolase)|nr:pyrophosphatase [Rikenellaceae bacterium]
MTIKEAQELVEAWVAKVPGRHRSELTAMAILTEEVGELARVIADKHSDPTQQNVEKVRAALSNELSDVMWALFTLANQSGIDLTEALIDNLGKKNSVAESNKHAAQKR